MRVNWREEEIRLLLTYYKRMKSGDMHKTHPLVLEASKAIRELEINKEYSSQSEKFRNPNGVALKLANFLFLDPQYEGKGMKGCSVLDRRVFNEEFNINQNEESVNKGEMIKYNRNLFPYKFESWLSSNNGGVRKPMDEQSGRPLGNEILESKIHRLIRSMVKDYVRNPKRTICVLVGGPGNGKTDLMEYVTECFLEEVGHDKQLGKKEIKAGFAKNNRKAIFRLRDYSLLLTQDASQRDDDSDNYLDALANDFKDLMREKSPLALICINRGILENLKNSAANSDEDVFPFKDIIDKIYELNNIDAIIQNKIVWGNDNISDLLLHTWSMDYDSLFGEEEADNLIQRIVEKSNCLDSYKITENSLHPANGTFNFLSNNVNNLHLSNLLRCIEVLNGKRFSYREVFSLMAFLFGISERENKQIEEKLYDLESLDGNNSIFKFQILFNLYQYTPSYKIFNTFLFANDQLKNSCIGAFKDDDINQVKMFLNSLQSSNKLSFSSIPKFIESGEVFYFDPIYFEQNNFEIHNDDGVSIQLKSIIDRVNYNEPLNIAEFSKIFPIIDIEIIKCVEKIKKDFCLEKDYDDLDSQQLNSLDEFKGYLNSLLISFIKRGLLFSKFFIRENVLIKDFIQLTNPAYSIDFLDEFKESISLHGKIQNSLSTSIGQTSDQVKHNVYAKSDMKRIVSIGDRNENLPSTDQIFFQYGERSNDRYSKFIVITYKIYKNIRLHSESIFPACLDKNYHLWNDLKKIELSDNENNSSNVFIEGMGAVKYDRRIKSYVLDSNL